MKKKDFGEADRLFYIYTEKLGMIMVSAKGVRLEKAKLRGNLGLFSFGEYAVISSKDFWKLVDAREVLSLKLNRDSAGRARLVDEQVKIFAKTTDIMIRMIKGEERNDNLWQETKNLFLKLFSASRGKDMGKGELKDLEIKSMAAILKILGYLDKTPTSRSGLISAVNRAIKESML